MMFRRVLLVVVSFLLVLLPLNFVHGQSATARVLGKVTDSQGAVLPNAKITVTNVNTKVASDATSDSNGDFQVPALPIGKYQVAASHDGFTSITTAPFILEINQSERIDLKMKVGTQAETVEVSAVAAGVETTTVTLGSSVTSRPIIETPLNGRNVLDLALLQPGVTPADNPGGVTQAGTFSIAGGRADSVTFLLDGGNNNNLLSNSVVFNPNPDTIAEFRILTSNYTAEYGRNGGGIVTVVTKSGTNSIHGSAYDFLRNDALNANSYFNNKAQLPRAVLKRNQFGATIGGPAIKDRVFWFFGYQGQRQSSQQSTIALNPFTPQHLRGDFSSLGTGAANPVAVFLNSHSYFQPNPALANQGIIDPTRIDPVAQKVIAASIIPTDPTGQAIYQGGAKDDRNELLLRVDGNVTEKDKLALTLGRNSNPRLFPFISTVGRAAPGFPSTTTALQQFFNLGYTRIFSSNVLNEARVTGQRNQQIQAVPAATAPLPSALGFTGIRSDDPTGPPRLSFPGLRTGFSVQGPTQFSDYTFSYSDTLSWTKGRHTMKFGGYFSPYDNNTVFDFFINGAYDFDPSSTVASCLLTECAQANFLFGVPNTYTQFPKAPSNIRTKSSYVFAQDEWHMFSNLVVTAGLRYEYSTPKSDTAGRSFSVIPGQRSTRFPNSPNGLVYPGDPNTPVGANFPDKNDFAPRLGFAWDPFRNGKTSIRGGIGVFFDILKGEDNLQFNGQAPFFGFASFGFPSGPFANGPQTFLADPFTSTGNPNSFPSTPPPSNIDVVGTFGSVGDAGVFFVDPNLRTPYTYQYNLSLQQELAKNMVFEAGYVGTSSHKLTALQDINPFDPATLSGARHRVLNELPGNNDGSFSYVDEFRNAGFANYNSLEVSVNKRPSQTPILGTTYFTVGYTWAHNIDNSSGFRQNNSTVPAFLPNIFRGSSDIDVRHRFTFSGGWDLPFTRGPKRLVQGWSVFPIFTFRTGFPLTVNGGLSQSQGRPGPSGEGDSQLVNANLVSPVVYFDPRTSQTIAGRTGNFAFDPTSFTFPGRNFTGVSTYGTAPRNLLRGPSHGNFDFAIGKTTPVVGERVSAEFRAEFFNILNRAQFKDPSVVRGSTFGLLSSTYDPRIIQFGLRIKF